MLAACDADARALILRHGFSCERVISVDRDSILYLNGCEKPRTLWLHCSDGPLRVLLATGFVADPPVDWHEGQPPDRVSETPSDSPGSCPDR